MLNYNYSSYQILNPLMFNGKRCLALLENIYINTSTSVLLGDNEKQQIIKVKVIPKEKEDICN